MWFHSPVKAAEFTVSRQVLPGPFGDVTGSWLPSQEPGRTQGRPLGPGRAGRPPSALGLTPAQEEGPSRNLFFATRTLSCKGAHPGETLLHPRAPRPAPHQLSAGGFHGSLWPAPPGVQGPRLRGGAAAGLLSPGEIPTADPAVTDAAA